MHEVFCADEMVQPVWRERVRQLRRSEDRMSKKIEFRVVSIWWDDVKKIYSDVEREQEVLINDDEIDAEIEVEMSKRWESDMIFWVAQRMRYNWRKQVIMKVEAICELVQRCMIASGLGFEDKMIDGRFNLGKGEN